jgi:hypothetical protein
MNQNPFDELVDFLKDKIILKSEDHYVAVSLWMAMALAIREFDFSPRLAIWSPEKRCGKTLLLEIIHHTLPHSKLTSNISASALYRTIEKDESCVILIDESDTIFGRNADKEKAEALRGIANAGFKRGQVVTRSVGKDFEPRDFHVFCPVALAGIGTSAIPDTVGDRSIKIEMRRKLPHENISEFASDEIEELFEPIQMKLEYWVEFNKDSFKKTKPHMPPELNSRAKDVWKPLMKIAENISPEWYSKAFDAAIALSAQEEDADEMSLSLRLLKDCKEIFVEEIMSTKNLLNALRSLEEAPWGSMATFNANLFAKLLKDYGISSQHWSTFRGYSRRSFEDAWTRYLPDTNTQLYIPEAVTAVTDVTVNEGFQAENDGYDIDDGFLPIGQQTHQFSTPLIQE